SLISTLVLRALMAISPHQDIILEPWETSPGKVSQYLLPLPSGDVNRIPRLSTRSLARRGGPHHLLRRLPERRVLRQRPPSRRGLLQPRAGAAGRRSPTRQRRCPLVRSRTFG